MSLIYSSTVALAMFGREDLGKYCMLLEEWKDAESSGKLPAVEVIQAKCGDSAHTEACSKKNTAIQSPNVHEMS